MAQYSIINVETIQKRIEEWENKYGNEDIESSSEAFILMKEFLSQSTPLLPEVSKAYDAGMLHKELSQMFDYPKGRYLNNLKLDI